MPARSLGIVALTALLLGFLAPPAAPQGATREITRIAGEVREGRSLDEVKARVRLPKYEAWRLREWFPLNIEGMYRHVQLHRRPNP